MTHDSALGMTYVSHARTLDELRDEFLSDLRRRLASVNGQAQTLARSAAEKAKLACAARELEDALMFWQIVTLAGAKRRKHAQAVQAVQER